MLPAQFCSNLFATSGLEFKPDPTPSAVGGMSLLCVVCNKPVQVGHTRSGFSMQNPVRHLESSLHNKIRCGHKQRKDGSVFDETMLCRSNSGASHTPARPAEQGEGGVGGVGDGPRKTQINKKLMGSVGKQLFEMMAEQGGDGGAVVKRATPSATAVESSERGEKYEAGPLSPPQSMSSMLLSAFPDDLIACEGEGDDDFAVMCVWTKEKRSGEQIKNLHNVKRWLCSTKVQANNSSK